MPGKLHWFKWEAAASWVSGILLLNLVYYHGGAMVGADSPVSALAAGAIGAGAIVLGWMVYDASVALAARAPRAARRRDLARAARRDRLGAVRRR